MIGEDAGATDSVALALCTPQRSRTLPVIRPEPLRRARRLAQSEWHARWRRAPLAQDLVLWISFDGVGMLCHPRAIFEAVLADPRYAHLKHVWIVSRDMQRNAEVRTRTQHPRVSVVAVDSPAHFRALATAKYLVNNSAFPAYFAKRPGQVYLNTWHGMPLEHVGYDLPDGRLRAANIVRNFLQADYLLSAGPAMTETLYEHAYRLDNIYRGTILEIGSPRVDVQFDHDARERLRAELARHGVAVATDRVALVAPTWPRGGAGDVPEAISRLHDHVTTLRATLGRSWTVLVTLHPHADHALRDAPALREAVVPEGVSVNLVLAGTDLLVTDASSLVFDYLPRDRPVIFMAPARGGQSDGGQFYLPRGEWPGPVVGDLEELAAGASRVAEGHDDFAVARRAWRARLSPLEDGRASARVIDIVFGARPGPSAERKLERDGRTRLLLYLGGMMRNGITSSALSLLHNIDHERVDVTCFFLDSAHPEQLRSAGEIDPRVRILLRSGGFTATQGHLPARPGRVRRRVRRPCRPPAVAGSGVCRRVDALFRVRRVRPDRRLLCLRSDVGVGPPGRSGPAACDLAAQRHGR